MTRMLEEALIEALAESGCYVVNTEREALDLYGKLVKSQARKVAEAEAAVAADLLFRSGNEMIERAQAVAKSGADTLGVSVNGARQLMGLSNALVLNRMAELGWIECIQNKYYPTQAGLDEGAVLNTPHRCADTQTRVKLTLYGMLILFSRASQ